MLDHPCAQVRKALKRQLVPVERKIRIEIFQKRTKCRGPRERKAKNGLGLGFSRLQKILKERVYLDFHAAPPFVSSMVDATLDRPLLKGAPRALAILDYGFFRVHSGPRDIGIQGALVETDAGERVLIDTGFPPKYADDFAAASAEDGLGAFGEVLHLGPDNLPAAQLLRLGVSPDQIDLLVLTHTHIDHVGGLDLASEAPCLIAAAERKLPKPLYWGDAQPLDWPNREYLLVTGDRELGPGFEVLFTPGHAPGQLSLWLTLPETGPILFTSDAISRPSEVGEGFAGAWDPGLAVHHASRILMRAARENATVIYGHCPEQWPSLRKAPERYL